mgnify:CR=1 FL=1
MTQEYYFKNAKWVGAKERNPDTFSVLRGHFHIKEKGKTTLKILGLGFFKCYINGVLINPDTFLPLSSDFEASCDPVDEVLSGHRIYVPEFDISDLINSGDNVISIHYGGGWYTFRNRVFGLPKAIYHISVENNEAEEFISDESCRVSSSYITEYIFTECEKHDYTDYSDYFSVDFDDSAWDNAVITEKLDTEYCTTDCPADALVEELPLKVVNSFDSGVVYDCGENTTGYPVLEIDAPKGEAVEVSFSEEIAPDGDLEASHTQGQRFVIISDGNNRTVQPDFVWYGFRYLKITGKATVKCVKVVYADVPVTSTFNSDNETLNWIYKTFTHTMLCNMHTGHPSDCPHLERRGYTGDGQLTCNAALTVLGARAFYEKWMQDIGDCQDTVSGHIQYTAPYIRSGGGPGGWGCAIVEVPYQLYLHYGDKEVLEKYYNNMRRYIDYLEFHSEANLVVSDKKGEWCLGDWCGPVILYPDKDITSHNQQVMLPAPMVNNYFMIKSLNTMCKIAKIISKDEDIPEYEEKISIRKLTTQAAYFNTFDDNFVMNVQGANAFAVDIGLGNEKTYENLVKYYTKLGHYDTGIFATDIVTRVLFEKGDADLAADLLVNDGEQGFEHWRKNGATTFHEYWDSNRSRSHNHPMFGAVVAYFFEHLLGIKQQENTAGYTSLLIEPKAYKKFGEIEGSILTPQGRVSVSYKNNNGMVEFKITIPENTVAVFKNGDKLIELTTGENTVKI